MLRHTLSTLNCLEVIIFLGSFVGWAFVGWQLCSRGVWEEECFLLFRLSVRPKMIYADAKYVNSTLAWRFSLEQVFTGAPSAYWTRLYIGWWRIRPHTSSCVFMWKAISAKQAIYAGKTQNRGDGLYEASWSLLMLLTNQCTTSLYLCFVMRLCLNQFLLSFNN